MRSRERNVAANSNVPRLLDTNELRSYTGLGKNKAMEIGEQIGAKVKFGRRTLWDRNKIDKYIDSITGAE